jgi:hypothetical protein
VVPYPTLQDDVVHSLVATSPKILAQNLNSTTLAANSL